MSIEDSRMIGARQEGTFFRPVQSSVMELNEKFPDLSVRITADTERPLDNLPIELERNTGIHNLGGWRLISFEAKKTLDEHLMLVKGDISTPEPLLLRVHSSMIFNEVFHVAASDDRDQLHTAMQQIHNASRGIIIYIDQEGAGNRLSTAVAQLALTNMGIPMIQAFEKLGVEVENRSFALATDMLTMMRVTAPIALMTNNQNKRKQIEAAGFTLVPYDFEVKPTSDTVAAYLNSKRDAGIYK